MRRLLTALEVRASPETGATGVREDSEVMPEGESMPGGAVMEVEEPMPPRLWGPVVGGRGPTVVVVPVVVIVSSIVVAVVGGGWG